MSSGGGNPHALGVFGVIAEPAIDDLGELSFQAAHGFFGALALVELAALVVAAGAGVDALNVGDEV